MSEPEAEIQATAANLSPVSPAPRHAGPALAVPTLQNTAETIDAMVAAVTEQAEAEAEANGNVLPLDIFSENANVEDVRDDDSFNDAYAIDNALSSADPGKEQQELPPDNDDYAKMFDSPGPEDDEDGVQADQQQQQQQPETQAQTETATTTVPRESNEVTISAEHLSTNPTESPASTFDQPVAQGHSAPPTTAQSVIKAVSDAASPKAPNSQDLDPALTEAERSHGSQDPARDAIASPVDIQQLMAQLAARSADVSNATSPEKTPSADADSKSMPSALPSASSLPPRPPMPHAASHSSASQHHPAGVNTNTSTPLTTPVSNSQPFTSLGAPGTSTEGIVPAVSAPGFTGAGPVHATYAAQPPAFVIDTHGGDDYQRKWDQFMADERKYMSEAKWDRFPEGSRLFIGNLSSDKVSKRDVFEIFHKFGRLAQISLKSAYGFVQYHTLEEGHAALANLEGTEIKGRRIHLEISKLQDKSKKERNRSPDKTRGRDRDQARRGDRFESGGRDDYRPSRGTSPRRHEFNSRESRDGYQRDRGSYDGGRGRGRSRSPSYGRNGKDSYRRRSPSPYRQPRHESELDLPRRYGADVPDVEIILQPDVHRDFVGWVEAAFKAKGLRTHAMFLHPRMPKDLVIQRQVVEGVHAVVDLNLRAQNMQRIPLQAFEKSGGMNNVRFDQYVDLDPSTAAEVVLRTKASGAQYSQSYGAPAPATAAGAYGAPYNGQPVPTPAGYPGGYPQQPPAAAPDLASIVGQLGHVDPATLQRLLSTVQTNPQMPAAGHQGAYMTGPPASAPPSTSQVDIQAILGNLGGPPAQQPPSHGAYPGAYGAQPVNGGASAQGDPQVQVQNIMSHLSRFRQ